MLSHKPLNLEMIPLTKLSIAPKILEGRLVNHAIIALIMSGTIECPTSSSQSLTNQSMMPLTKLTTTPMVASYMPLNASTMPCPICLTASQAPFKSPLNSLTIAVTIPETISTTPLIASAKPATKLATAVIAPAIGPVTRAVIMPPRTSNALPIKSNKSRLLTHSTILLITLPIASATFCSHSLTSGGRAFRIASPALTSAFFILSQA